MALTRTQATQIIVKTLDYFEVKKKQILLG